MGEIKKKKRGRPKGSYIKANPVQAKKLRRIMALVSQVTNISVKAIQGPIRRREYVDARRLYSVLAKKNISASYAIIGQVIEKDHASIMHYYREHDALMRTDHTYKDHYEICMYAMKANDEMIKLREGEADYVDALVAENRHLRQELNEANKLLSVIRTAMSESVLISQ